MTGLILLIAALLVTGSAHPQEVGSEATIAGLHQERLVLGDPDAPVELVEYGDLQCPICREYADHKLPQVIAGPIAAGEAKLRFANFGVIGPQSTVAATAALAAGEQGRGWQFLEAFFRHQGTENSGYVTPAFLERIAGIAGVEDTARWQSERKSARLRKEAVASTRRAAKLGFTGTPSFTVRGPAIRGTVALGTPYKIAEILEAIDRARGGGTGELVRALGPAVRLAPVA